MNCLWFVVPVHGREALTRICLKQLKRTCAALAPAIQATAVVIGEDSSVDYAQDLGFATVRRDNAALGRKFNDGYQLACDPEFNPEPADYAVPCGSDDWIDPAVLAKLPANAIGIFRQLALVNETRTKLSKIHVGFAGGAGIRVIPAHLLKTAGYRPAEEDRKRACDMSTLYGISEANRRQMPRMVAMDVHPLQIIDWKTNGQQLNSYEVLRGYRRGTEVDDPFNALADVYPAEALDEMRELA